MSPKIYPDVLKSQILITLSPRNTVQEAVSLMATRKIGAVVITTDDQLKGIFTERDVVLRVVSARLNPDQTPLEQVMTPNPYTISLTDNAIEALQIMQTNHFRHLPVLDQENKVVGIISVRDLFAVVIEQLERDLRQTENYLFGSGYS